MNILIIGGTNFIGPVVIQRLLGAGHAVTLFHRSQCDTSDGCRHVQGDCADSAALGKAIKATSPDIIIHMIALFQSHIEALEQALEGRPMKTVILSSIDVYKGYEVFTGLSDASLMPVPFMEDSPLRDVLYPYRGKLDTDFAHDYDKILVERAALQSSVIETVILRLGMVYGANDPNRRLADAIHKMASGEKTIELQKDMALWRGCKCYVKNIAHGIVLAAEHGRPGGIYNLTDEWVFTERQWLKLLARQMKWRGEIIITDEPAPGVNASQHFFVDTAKIRNELGYREMVSVDEALTQTIRWELAQSY